MNTIYPPCIFALALGLMLIGTSAGVYGADTTEWPERGTVLVIGDADARELVTTRGAGGLLVSALRSEPQRRFWRFDHLGRDGVGELTLAIPGQFTRINPPPLAIVLQVGHYDAWDSRRNEPRLDAAAYQTHLEELIAAIRALSDAPIIMGSPLLIGEDLDDKRPENVALNAIAAVNRSVAQKHELRHFDARGVLVTALRQHSEDRRNRHILTRDGERLLPAAWQMLTPPLAAAFGLTLGGPQTTGVQGRQLANVQRVLRVDFPPRPSPHMVHMLGDMRFMHDIDSGAMERPQNILALRWPQQPPLLFHRGRRNGGQLFSTPTDLAENLGPEIIGAAIPPSLVIIGYGFRQTNDLGLGEEQPDPTEVFAGLREAVAHIRKAGIQVILVTPYPMRGDNVAAALNYAQRCEQILASIAAQTGSILAVGREEYERLKNQQHFIQAVGVDAISRSLGLDPSSWR